MTGKTHKKGAELSALISFYYVLYMGYPEVAGLHPIIYLIIIYPFALYGGVLPDIDHNSHANPCKDIINVQINRILHIPNKVYDKLDKTLSTKQKKNSIPYKISKFFRCSHRSWQTHSEIILIVAFGILYYLTGVTKNANTIVLIPIMYGLILGILSHIILDMLTTDGAKSFFGHIFKKDIKIAFKLVTTGTESEKKFAKLLNVFSYILLFLIILYFWERRDLELYKLFSNLKEIIVERFR